MAYLAAWRAWTRPAAYSVEFDCIVPLVVAFCAETEATATSAAVRKALIDMLAVVREERRKKRRRLNEAVIVLKWGRGLGHSSSADRHARVIFSFLSSRE